MFGKKKKAEPDRRITRTRELLLNALVSLMIERGYDRITVQDLLDRSGVGRATFYAHFQNKEELLAASVERLRQGLERECASLRVRQRDVRLGYGLALFRHVDSHRRIYLSIVGRKGQAVVERYMRRMLLDLVRQDVGLRRGRSTATSPREAVAHFIVGGLWSLLVWWMESRASLTAEEVHAIFVRLAAPGIAPEI